MKKDSSKNIRIDPDLHYKFKAEVLKRGSASKKLTIFEASNEAIKAWIEKK